MFKEIKEKHEQGFLTIENIDIINQMILEDKINNKDTDIGLKISYDGRLWICINGIAFLRFKPKGD